MKDGDGVFLLNFRADRAREILSALAAPAFDGFETGDAPRAAHAGHGRLFEGARRLHGRVFPKTRSFDNTLGHWVAQGLRQFHVAETEKYPHVTFFLNGGVEAPEPGEDRVMPPSPAVATYDLQPEMSAGAVTEAPRRGAIGEGYDLIVVNYANPDMVGHTGDLAAAARACEAVDEGLGRALAALEGAGGAMIDLRRSRKLRDDGRPGDGPAAHGPYVEPRARGPGRRPRGRADAGRQAGRPGADAAGPDGDRRRPRR